MPEEGRVLAVPIEIVDLVERFERDQSFFKSAQFNETELRTRFINPLIAALGWDVYHDQPGRADQHEVKEEDSVEVEGKIKNPDYSFRLFDGSLGSMKRKFFMEVKRPSVNIEAGAYPAFQLRRYAFSADLPISILTDFEEFSVYYCLSRPNREDKPTKSRIMYLRYDQYAEKWEEIAALFSREAVLNGSLERYARSLPQKRGEKRVDAALLGDISRWREALAKNIALGNPELDTASLNYSVQAIIDRIMFLRICEDRGIERYMRLKHLLEGERVYARLFELFQQADERYNSGIFHFHKEPGRDKPDIITPGLKIDDGILKDIIKELYLPVSPYAFSVLPAEILGQIYEQFLGQVIRLDQDHRAVVEDKPEVKKAGGVKYTPAYIVEAIVQKTLGPTLQGRTARQASEIAVLDPACGSGSFLIVAYQFLLDWHRDWYVQHLLPLMERGCKPSSPEIRRLLPETEPGRKGRKREAELPIFQSRDGEWRLTTAERKRILLSNIYGVDIDRQAVEVTKLSLLLKVLEGENEETISKQLTLFQERALPDLGENIKCGNSLIGWDILEDNPGLGQEEIERINPFDWEREFAEVFKRGGFDAVIGNPPYIRIQAMTEWAPLEVENYKRKYASAGKGNYDIYVIFVEKGLDLLNETGRLGFILPHKFFNAKYGLQLRAILSQGKHISEIVHFGYQQVFEGVTTYTCLLLLSKRISEDFKFTKVDSLDEWRIAASTKYATVPASRAGVDEWIFVAGKEASLLDKLSGMRLELKDVTSRIFQGIKTSADKIFIVKKIERKPGLVRIFSKERNGEYWIESDLVHPLIKGGDSRRYSLSHKDLLILFPYAREGAGPVKLIPEMTLKTNYPLTWTYLHDNKDYLENRENGRMRGDKWYGYIYPKALDVMSLPKIFTPDIATSASFSLDETGETFFTGGVAGGYGILPNPDYSMKSILALLNSRLLDWIIRQTSTQMNGGYYSYESRFISGLPICNLALPENITLQDRMVALVEQMLALHKQLPLVRTPHEQTALERRIEATDRQIDALVYELYALTEEEIAIVEGDRGNK